MSEKAALTLLYVVAGLVLAAAALAAPAGVAAFLQAFGLSAIKVAICGLVITLTAALTYLLKNGIS